MVYVASLARDIPLGEAVIFMGSRVEQGPQNVMAANAKD